jgi:hypothetical protein
MAHERAEAPLEPPFGSLERALIDEFLLGAGHDWSSLHQLPEAARVSLLAQASLYASSRLSEVEARSHYVHDLHDAHIEPPRGPNH